MEQIIEIFEKIVIPILTAVLGFLGGMHIERRKTKTVSKIRENSNTINGNNNNVNQGNIINK